jgi:hypothetical protein
MRHPLRDDNGRDRANQIEAGWREAERKNERRLEQQQQFTRLVWAEHLLKVYSARAEHYRALVLEMGGVVD